jgi:hypothetical protein
MESKFGLYKNDEEAKTENAPTKFLSSVAGFTNHETLKLGKNWIFLFLNNDILKSRPQWK